MLKYLIEKEFKQIRRNSFLPRLFVMMPLMMMLVMPWAANQEIRGVKVCIIDHDRSTLSERMVHKIVSSGYFTLAGMAEENGETLRSIEDGSADMILEIQPGFERDLVNEGVANVLISANAVNGVKSGLGSSYLVSILAGYGEELRDEYARDAANPASGQVEVIPQYRFNPHLDYKVFMVPALMVMLLTLFSGFIPALNIVGEKEAGTMEQINVTPVKKFVFVLSKLIPCWVIGFAVFTFCMGLAVWVYSLVPAGSVLTIYLFASLYMVVVSGMGLVISNYSATMQQALFVMFFFLIIFILMSGLFTPVSSMPVWAQRVTVVNPLKYFMQVMRLVYLKGSAFRELWPQFAALVCFAVVLNTWAVLSYKKND
ncbi:MAG: ABC transporter permease [Parabacteroides sp.]|nr:ABC transporter permease [Parabacteroides sp.]